ncbi:substrate-binding domain-containing protein [Streptomyces beigongshangae]|uniref:substrate-binding domain-containing protein n=1 Tax=Streptomyces beigongshangae TaxID=2841597 RepID=UPI003D31E42F
MAAPVEAVVPKAAIDSVAAMSTVRCGPSDLIRRAATGVFCANDLLALGVLQALYEAGLRVPEDIAVVGYDDIEFAASAVVPLTSVRRPAVAMGRQAGRLLIEDTTSGFPHEHAHVVLQPELVVRRSTTAVPGR